jgi:hypothetical protein
VGAPLFIPASLRSRVEANQAHPGPSRYGDRVSTPRIAEARSSPHLDRTRGDVRGGLGDALMGWVGLAIALAIGSFALLYARREAHDDSVVTAWVAGVVTSLAVGPSALFVVLAHRELRRSWPITILGVVALLGFFVLRLG